MKDAHLDFATMTPFMNPRAAPVKIITMTGSNTLPVRVMRMARIAPSRDICDPTDMSKSPEIRMRPTPTATMPAMDICPSTLSMFCGLMKFLFTMVMAMESTMINAMRNPD